jgi:hypothetical protein
MMCGKVVLDVGVKQERRLYENYIRANVAGLLVE